MTAAPAIHRELGGHRCNQRSAIQPAGQVLSGDSFRLATHPEAGRQLGNGCVQQAPVAERADGNSGLYQLSQARGLLALSQ